jgi:hypothetical protein
MTRDLQHQKSTWEHLNLQMSAWHRDPGSHCLNSLAGRPFAAHEVFAQEEAISGYRAAKLTTHLPTLNATRWYAEDHGCAMIQSISDFGAGGVTEDKLVALSDGEPDSSLFATAPDLRETTPGELITGGPCSKGPKPCEVTARKFDESYNRNHALLARLMHLAR